MMILSYTIYMTWKKVDCIMAFIVLLHLIFILKMVKNKQSIELYNNSVTNTIQ